MCQSEPARRNREYVGRKCPNVRKVKAGSAALYGERCKDAEIGRINLRDCKGRKTVSHKVAETVRHRKLLSV